MQHQFIFLAPPLIKPNLVSEPAVIFVPEPNFTQTKPLSARAIAYEPTGQVVLVLATGHSLEHEHTFVNP